MARTNEDFDAVINSAKRRAIELTSRREYLVEDKVESIGKISDATNYIKNSAEVYQLLEELQLKTQSKEKKLFEGLLTSLLNEVIDGNDDKIYFDSKISRNQSELDIKIISNGKVEDVYKDKGGSIKNIISMGLRFIVLSRSSNRRFLIFDEADCWLKSKYIPAFSRVIHQLSVKTGVQVVYISHHESYLLKDSARIVEISKDDAGLVRSKCMSDVVTNAESVDLMGGVPIEERQVIKYLRIKNFKQHKDTFIELSPFLTVITGENDLGKSGILEAFEVLTLNKMRPGLLNHDGDKASIEIGIEDDYEIAFKYKAKGAKKGLIQLSDSDGVVIEELREMGSIPNWLNDYLAMSSVRNINLHIHDQDSTCFMMGAAFPPSVRAKLLPLSKGGEQAQKMIKVHGERLTSSKRAIKTEEKRISNIDAQLQVLSHANFLDDQLAEIEVSHAVVMEGEDALKLCSEEVVRLALIEKEVVSMELVLDVPNTDRCSLSTDEILDMDFLLTEIKSLQSLEGKMAVYANSIDSLIDFSGLDNSVKSQVEDFDFLVSEMRSMAKADKDCEALSKGMELKTDGIEIKGFEEDNDCHLIADLQSSLGSQEKLMTELAAEAKSVNLLLAAAGVEKEQLIKESGEVCLLCKQPYPHNHKNVIEGAA